MLKKIFTVKILSFIFAVLAVIIAALSLYRSDIKEKKEEERVNEANRQKYLEEMDNSHENLFLSFDCFPLIKNKYNIDVILPPQSESFMIVQTTNINNNGRKTAKNTELSLCINDDCKFMLLLSQIKEEAKDTIYPQGNLAK